MWVNANLEPRLFALFSSYSISNRASNLGSHRGNRRTTGYLGYRMTRSFHNLLLQRPTIQRKEYRKMTMAKYFLAALLVLPVQTLASLTAQEHLEGYLARNYTWRPKFQRGNDGWQKLMTERLEQVHEIDDLERRYEGYMQTVTPAMVAPNFTELGFGLTRCPEDLIADLRNAIHDGLAAGDARSEGPVEVIDGPQEPLFIDRPDLTARVLHELHPYVEAWAGIEVTPYTAYGLRLYQNESALWMHVDKVQTHILSFILHIDKSDDAEDWPIFIEGKRCPLAK